MEQKQRIRTEIGKDHKINVQLKQEFGLLEILSLKLSQQDIYTSICSDYGVVCGRVTVNNGYGVPNARVSIFIPQLTEHEEDPVISALYPYKSYGDRTEEGFRYNLLPARRQHSGHVATGTFPDQIDILSREDVLEVYENYYRYTVKTNDAGDFMIWGVPLGEQLIHVDLDLSDMGCFSLRPDDFIRKGFGIEDFTSAYEFKASEDLDSLPQIVTFDKGIEVYPFWGNEDLCEIGITRVDFDLSEKGLKVEPSAMIIGGTFTDDGKSAVNKNCKPRKHMGKKCSFTTQAGSIEAIRFSPYYDENKLPVLEEYTVTDEINDDGSFAFRIPMNRDFLYTTEFGENDYTNDPNKGIPTSSCYRFRFTLTDEGLERVRARASYLVPNIREFEGDEERSYAWSLQFSGYPQDAQGLILNNIDGDYYPQDYFYRFYYGKVYTVSSFQSMMMDSPKRMLGINDIVPSEDKDCSSNVVTFPTNMGIKNTSFNFQLLLSLTMAFLQFVVSQVILTAFEFLGSILKRLSDAFDICFNIDVIDWSWCPFGKVRDYLLLAAFNLQEAGQLTLPLTIYDDCDPCNVDEDAVSSGFNPNEYCKIAEFNMIVTGITGTPSSDGTYITISPALESEILGSSIYYPNTSIPQRECYNLTGCCESYSILDNGYSPLNTLTTNNPPGSTTTVPRFRIKIGGNAASTGKINPTDFYISSTVVDFSSYPIIEILPGIWGFKFDDAQIKGLFGVDNGASYFSSTGHSITSGLTGYIIDLDKQKPTQGSFSGITAEEGCEMYDTLYDESITNEYIWVTGNTWGSTYDPDPSQQLTNDPLNGTPAGFLELPVGTLPPDSTWSIGASVWYKDGGQTRLPRTHEFGSLGRTEQFNRKTKTGLSEFRDGVFIIVPSIDGFSIKNARALSEWYKRQLIGIQFCGGIVNFSFIDNWLSGAMYFFQFKAKLKDKKNGLKVKACKTVVKYIPDHEKFYYRSCVYKYDANPNAEVWGSDNGHDNEKYIGHPTTFVDLGPRDEFINEICTDKALDPNCSVSRSIGPTSFKSFGELVAFAVNYKMDVRQAKMKINDFFKNNGFYSLLGKDARVFNGDISQLISINSEAGIDGFDMQNRKYLGYSISTLDPDDFDDKVVFTNSNDPDSPYGPTPITLQYEDDGVRVRQCINAPGYLTEASQKVPFYLWDKKGPGFGLNNPDKVDDQCWDYSKIYVNYLQGMTYGYKFTGATTDPDDAYLLPPMSYDFIKNPTGYIVTGATGTTTEEFNEVIDISDPTGFTPPLTPNGANDHAAILHEYDKQYHGFTILLATGFTDPINPSIMDPTGGRLYIRLGDGGNWMGPIFYTDDIAYSIWPSLDPYSVDPLDFKQILSTPFMFYFGLRPGKTGLDLLIQRFGPKGAFKPIE